MLLGATALPRQFMWRFIDPGGAMLVRFWLWNTGPAPDPALQQYGILGLFLWTTESSYMHLVCIAGNELDLSRVGIGLCQNCPLSLDLFRTFMDRTLDAATYFWQMMGSCWCHRDRTFSSCCSSRQSSVRRGGAENQYLQI